MGSANELPPSYHMTWDFRHALAGEQPRDHQVDGIAIVEHDAWMAFAPSPPRRRRGSDAVSDEVIVTLP